MTRYFSERNTVLDISEKRDGDLKADHNFFDAKIKWNIFFIFSHFFFL